MRHFKTNTLVIQTPEGIVFPFLLASPITRFLAWIVDIACIGILCSICGSIISIVGWISFDISRGLLIFCYFIISIGYGMVMEWYWRGQTLGKRLLHLRVVDAQGLHLHFSQIVVRNLLRAVDSLPGLYLFGGIVALINTRGQRLGDIAANTIVIRNPPSYEPDLKQILAGKYNSFRNYPHLTALLRQRVSVEESGIALQALLRRDELDPVARVELYTQIANRLRQAAPFPQEATDGISDEQYVRNVVDIIFERKGS